MQLLYTSRSGSQCVNLAIALSLVLSHSFSIMFIPDHSRGHRCIGLVCFRHGMGRAFP